MDEHSRPKSTGFLVTSAFLAMELFEKCTLRWHRLLDRAARLRTPSRAAAAVRPSAGTPTRASH